MQFHGNTLTHQGNHIDKGVEKQVLRCINFVLSRLMSLPFLHRWLARSFAREVSRSLSLEYSRSQLQWPLKFGIPQHGYCQHFNCCFAAFLMVAFNCFFVVDRLLIAVGSFFIRWLFVCVRVCVFCHFSAKAYFTRKINERRQRRQRRSEEKTFQLNWMNDKKIKLAHYFEKFFWKNESFLQSCLSFITVTRLFTISFLHCRLAL